jgi:rubrerythrin
MSYDFNAEEIFLMAEQIERNGAQFYRSAAESIQEQESKDLLLGLAGMEDEHLKTFQTMRSALTEKDMQPTVFDPAGEAVLYLKALADTRVFFEKKIDISSMKGILTAAIAAEKDSIVFYLGMKEAVPDKFGKQRIDAIIKEEMHHIQILSKELVARK